MLKWKAAVLWSINDRLGGGDGINLPMLEVGPLMQDTIDAQIQQAQSGNQEDDEDDDCY